jgi:hypothetical protein
MSTKPSDANRCHYRVGEIDRRSLIPLLGAGAAFLMLAGKAQAQQVPIPKTPAEVPGPPPGTAMTTAYVQSVGRMAYLWGWPLVDVANRAEAFSKAPEPGLLGGVVPVAFNRNAMLTGYISPDEHFVTCPNQDVVYGAGYFNLDKETIVFQVPEFGDRFWVYALYDARTDEFSEIGKAYGTKPGFYLVVGPDWKGQTAAGSRRWCGLPRRRRLSLRAFLWMTPRRITRPSSRCSIRSSSTRCRSSTAR